MNTQVIFNVRKTDGNTDFTGYITFNELDINIGNGHNGATFVAPFSGLYKFSFFGTTGYGYPGLEPNYTMINVEKNYVLSFTIYDEKPDVYHVGNNMAATWMWNLDKDDKVGFSITSRTMNASKASPIFLNGELIHKN